MCSSTQRIAVGLELRRTERPQQPPPRDGAHDNGGRGDGSDHHAAAAYQRAIMHRVIPCTLFDAVVQYEASADALCHQLGVGRSEALLLCFASRDDDDHYHAPPRAARQKRHAGTPQSVLDAAHTPLDTARFERLFQPLSEHETRFGALLMRKLGALCERERARVRAPPPPPQQQRAEKRKRGSFCGFSRRVHGDISVVSDGVGIMKTGRGLYRSTKSVGCMDVRKRATYYYEAVVVDDVNAGGICIGVCSEQLALNQMLGSDELSCGLHSSGQLVRRGGSFEPFGARGFGRGDRVGVLVRRAHDGEQQLDVTLAFLLNGAVVGECVMKGLADVRWLWATVCLYREGSKVVLQCCRHDWSVRAQQLAAVLGDAASEVHVSCICCSS